jgi:hypothetical protein
VWLCGHGDSAALRRASRADGRAECRHSYPRLSR